MKFVVGETVVYPHHGAAKIVEVADKTLRGETKTYLQLKVAQGELTIWVPAENVEMVGVRDVIDKKGVEQVFGVFAVGNGEVASVAEAVGVQAQVTDYASLVHRIAKSDLTLFRAYIEGRNLPATFVGSDGFLLAEYATDMANSADWLTEMGNSMDAQDWNGSAAAALEGGGGGLERLVCVSPC
mgnify:CR=1 FL=1